MRIAPKLVWTAVPVLLALAAALDAHAITTLVGAGLAPDARALAAAHGGTGAGPANSARPPRSADAILARNPFDHATSLAAAAAATDSFVEVGSPNPDDAPPCDGVRVAAIAASSDPEWSFAALSTTSDPKASLRRRGDAFGDRSVAFVGWDRVWLAHGVSLCQTSLFTPAAKDGGTPGKTPAVPTVSVASSVPPAIARGIRKNGPNDYDIDRATFDKILESQHELMAQTRIAPETIDGRVAGLRLLGIKPDSLLAMMGLSNNDRLEAINGLDISSPEHALEAYARIRNGDTFNVRVTRDKKPMTLDFHIK
jgi:general secretion pathway protein C